ncbi:DUF349 domain-containing protein [Reinekea blandensis]|uniref:DUF349 domain-containing protein n=1 Tax=Reinekea blandensis MED297 TaxID=314283 RepID=A4BJV4_9GAMM|nr:DUF349 domain-containing protein [Reinekea blandensis]EAR07621.1 hypothetical protein MED297_00350 [Reinekea sp. MED297] [Reinekea blandensis MED297]
MFRKLFSRKPSKTEPPRSKSKSAEPAVAADTHQTWSVSQWAEQIQAAQGKARTQLLSELVQKIRAGEIDQTTVKAALPDTFGLMLMVELDAVPEDVDETVWASLVLSGFTAKVRKVAAARVVQLELLNDLVRQTKGRDKAVYRILHATQEQLQAEQRRTEALVNKQNALLGAIERHAEAPLEPMYAGKLKGLTDQWRELTDISEEANTRFQKAQQQAESKIEAARQREREEANVQTHIAMADTNRQSLVEQLMDRLHQRLDEMALTDEAMNEDQHLLSEVQHQWNEIEKHSKADTAEARTFQKACTAYEVGLARLQRLLTEQGSFDALLEQLGTDTADNDQLLHDIDDWLHDLEGALRSEAPQGVVRLRKALEAYQKSLEAHRQQAIQQVRAIRSQLRRCQQAIDDGSLRRASGLYHGAQEKLEGFDLDYHAGIRKQLEDTTEALEKLRDWQAYAVLPKKEALIRRMKGLTEHSMDPESRSQAIREMQDEWKLLSRGLQDRQQDLWETFHELAQQAYEPCREYFAEQKHLREVNLERRREIIDQLGKYADIINWDVPDIKEIDRVLQVARNDWRHYSPVDRTANKPLQAEFDRLHQSVFERMREVQSVARANKEVIIQQAKSLLELEDIKAATDQAKALQREWKSAGMVARRDEQQLWKAFRTVCDELFARRDQQVSDFKADLQSHRQEAERIIDAIQTLAGEDDVVDRLPEYEQLKSDYQAVGTLPKSHYSRLSQDFRSACQTVDQACQKLRSEQADRHWQALIDWVRKARFSGISIEEMNEQWQQLDVPSVAEPLSQAFASWLEAPDELNIAAMHEKTIDLEILVGVDSPQVDAEIRMNLQVQRLSEGLGQQSNVDDVHRRVVEWLSLGAVPEADYDLYEPRMKSARQAGLIKN